MPLRRERLHRHHGVDGASHAAVVTYPGDPAGMLARWVAGRMVELLVDEAGVTVADALNVTAGRWRSYSCTDPACCPPEGTPLTDPTGDTP